MEAIQVDVAARIALSVSDKSSGSFSTSAMVGIEEV
jgi:hypothetical protein